MAELPNPPVAVPDVAADLSKDDRKAVIEDLRLGLVNAQYRLKDANFPVLVLLGGRDRIGTEQVVDRLHEWMDGRYLDSWFATPRTEEERTRPGLWRFWRAMPPNGRTGLFAGGWIVLNIRALMRGDLGRSDYRRRVLHGNNLERLLVDDGVLLLKIWLDLPAEAMKKRLDKLHKNPAQARYAEELDWEIHETYDKATPLIERMLKDSSDVVPWQVIDGSDEKARDLAVARLIHEAMEWRLDAANGVVADAAPAAVREGDEHPIVDHLANVKLQKTIAYDKYKERLKKFQVKLHDLSLQMREQKLACVLAFEGWDAAGKGGVIRRVTQAISARDCKVFPIAAPTDEELARNYLWRFWRRLPRDGYMHIFDRSWYGRVLVERVEGFATESEWRRAYDEINDFESQLTEHGNLVLKFWLHIDPHEQLARFRAREQTHYKKYKITDEDYRNRERWEDYVHAVNEMVTRTDTKNAPWILVPANDKRYARIRVLKILCKQMEAALEGSLHG
ncbi:MAG: polyphosphate:AMP phosphotransferase [Gammaproteobacteria bacterium]|nr:polyphosphate:AMP phosphotransferase [Gammaproteobacteria bacterium]